MDLEKLLTDAEQKTLQQLLSQEGTENAHDLLARIGSVGREEPNEPLAWKLSDQALSAIMFVLQKCLMEETDITDLLRDLDFAPKPNLKLYVLNPPNIRVTPEIAEILKQRLSEKQQNVV